MLPTIARCLAAIRRPEILDESRWEQEAEPWVQSPKQPDRRVCCLKGWLQLMVCMKYFVISLQQSVRLEGHYSLTWAHYIFFVNWILFQATSSQKHSIDSFWAKHLKCVRNQFLRTYTKNSTFTWSLVCRLCSRYITHRNSIQCFLWKWWTSICSHGIPCSLKVFWQFSVCHEAW